MLLLAGAGAGSCHTPSSRLVLEPNYLSDMLILLANEPRSPASLIGKGPPRAANTNDNGKWACHKDEHECEGILQVDVLEETGRVWRFTHDVTGWRSEWEPLDQWTIGLVPTSKVRNREFRLFNLVADKVPNIEGDLNAGTLNKVKKRPTEPIDGRSTGEYCAKSDGPLKQDTTSLGALSPDDTPSSIATAKQGPSLGIPYERLCCHMLKVVYYKIDEKPSLLTRDDVAFKDLSRCSMHRVASLFRELRIVSDSIDFGTTVLVLGSGNGRALLHLALHTDANCVGVETNPFLHCTALMAQDNFLSAVC